MRLAFMGTPDFSVPVLGELVAGGHEISAVYTQPPRPAGRGRKDRKSPIHLQAEAFGLPVRTPVNFKAEDDRAAFRALDLDIAIVVSYGLILPGVILEAPQLGCLNLHASLLPRWRGAAPIHRAVMAGDTETGVQVMQMEPGLDTGPVLLSETTPIRPDDTTGSVHDRLSMIGAQLVPRALMALQRGSIEAQPQGEDGVTYAHKIQSDEARIDWSRPAGEVDCHIRGLSPSPGAWSMLEGERVKILMSRTRSASDTPAAPGTVIATGDVLTIACGDGAVDLLTLQRPGKTPQPVAEFLKGKSLEGGTIFDLS